MTEPLPLAPVLVVDDELACRLSAEAILGERFQVAGAANGAEALAELAKRPFDVVLTDFEMPGQTGLQLLRQVSERYPEVMGILVTGHAELPEVLEAQAGELMVRVLAKPYDPSRLLRWVETSAQLARLRRSTQRLARRTKPD